MENFITRIEIKNVRHLKNILINLSTSKRTHLILTGKNGSGKTSVLEAMKSFLSMYTNETTLEKLYQNIETYKKALSLNNDNLEKMKFSDALKSAQEEFHYTTKGVLINLISEIDAVEKYKNGEFIISFYSANRYYKTNVQKHIEKIEFKENYKLDENPGRELVKYLLDLKTTQALAEKAKKTEKSDEIEQWFVKFENLLKTIFDDETLVLDFDIESFQFTIIIKDRQPFNFNEMSSGYSAILDIVADIMLRMEKNAKGFYNTQGIVLIDELETHLHLDLQKKIFPFLTTFFPNIQFIITTHSPFILSSAENVIIYDLENNTEVTDGLRNLPYNGIVEGYFEVDSLSKELKTKFTRYKELSQKTQLDISDYDELADIECYLDEIPDYLAFDFLSEYSKLKLEFEDRG